MCPPRLHFCFIISLTAQEVKACTALTTSKALRNDQDHTNLIPDFQLQTDSFTIFRDAGENELDGGLYGVTPSTIIGLGIQIDR